MTQLDVYFGIAVAAVASLAIVAYIVSRSSSLAEASDTLRRVAYLMGVGFYSAVLIVVTVLLAIGYATKEWNYWLIAFVVFGIGTKIYQDFPTSRMRSTEWIGRSGFRMHASRSGAGAQDGSENGAEAATAGETTERSGEDRFQYTFSRDVSPTTDGESVTELPDGTKKFEKTFTFTFSFGDKPPKNG